MADDAKASASAQDPTLAGEGATDINALDQGMSYPLHRYYCT
jgi:hypothetical protein